MLVIISVCLIRNLLDKQQDVNSDGEDEEEFVPSKKELQSSSEDEEEEVGLDSDEEVVLKKGRRATASSRTPRSKQKSRSSTRTPRKTPKKVRDPSVHKRREVTSMSSPD